MEDYKELLLKYYLREKNKVLMPHFKKLKMYNFCRLYFPKTSWAIGPFAKDESLTFKKRNQLQDPTGIGWKSSSIFNPSLIAAGDGKLYLFYRAGVKKESLCSRIGMAVYDEQTGWQEIAEPCIVPSEEDEILTVEDPKVYKYGENKYIMFYNGGYYPSKEQALEYHKLPNSVCIDIKCALSDDLIHWEKKGLVVPHKISRLWAKGAVIPRNGFGEAVMINGYYMMFLSEGCGGKQYIGYSKDMLSWEFKQQTYLNFPAKYCGIDEVACCIVGQNQKDVMVLDVYCHTKIFRHHFAVQVLYNINEPTKPVAMHKGGTLAWGGVSIYKGKYIFPQGWDSPKDEEEIYFYTAPIAH